MAGVFISYRREDSPGHAGRVFDRVRARFGGDVVFMDVTAIDAGVDFVEEIERAVGTCDVLLAVIGPQWGSATDGAGRKRLDSPTDFVRVEIGGALKRNVRVVPVLVDGAQLPSASDLPDDLQPLLRRNAIELRDARWDADIDQLIASLERIVTAPVGPLRLERKASGHLRWLAALAMLVLAVGATAVFGPRACAPGSGGGSTATTTAPPAAPQNASAAPAPVEPRPRPTTPTTPPRERPAPASRGVTTPTATATVPDVVGKPLSDAREVLRRAGVDVARILYRDDRLKAVDLVVAQSEARTLAGRPPAVDLTAVARAAVIIHYTPEDADVARALLGALMTVPVPAGTAFHTRELSTIRPETVSRVTYSDADLTEAGVEIAKAATAWLRQNEPDRRGFAAMRHPRLPLARSSSACRNAARR